MPYASSTETVFSGLRETIRLPANKWSTLAEIASSDSANEKTRRPAPISPPGAKPPIANFDGSCDRLAYLPCNTAEIAGLNAAMPDADDVGGGAAGRGGAGGAAASLVFAVSASFSFCSSA